VRLTIELPPHRVARLLELLASIAPTQKRIRVVQWHQLLGELRSMLLGIPGAQGLFSVLQEAFRHQKDNRVHLSQSVHAFLDDFRWLAQDLTGRPTRLAEILPQDPAAVGAIDAAGAGMGGVWYVESTAPRRQRDHPPRDTTQPLATTDATPQLPSSPSSVTLASVAQQHASTLFLPPQRRWIRLQ
jgi:hypothetical protein